MKTREIMVRDIKIGGKSEIIIQSMTNTDTANVEKTVAQIKALEEQGCQLVRMTINTKEAAYAISKIKEQVSIPLVADIHFDYKLALLAMENGIDKLRLNPGNIGSEENIERVVTVAKEKNIPIRIGVNSGSLEKHILEKYGHPTSEGMVESALYHVGLLEKFGFNNIIISIKSSNVRMMIEAYKKISKLVDYPLHLGVTEAGTAFQGTIKSAIGIGALLAEGIGSTIRVSLTEDPVEEIKVARGILEVLGLREGVEIISCPTCGRTAIDLINLAKKVENEIKKSCEEKGLKLKIAVMGCVVNGPGEAAEADYGVAGGQGVGVIFKKGLVIKTVKENEILGELKRIISEDFSVEII